MRVMRRGGEQESTGSRASCVLFSRREAKMRVCCFPDETQKDACVLFSRGEKKLCSCAVPPAISKDGSPGDQQRWVPRLQNSSDLCRSVYISLKQESRESRSKRCNYLD